MMLTSPRRRAIIAPVFALLLPALACAAPSSVDPRLSSPGGSDTEFLAAFSQASTEWGNGVEALIEEAYRKCFRTYIVSGKVLTLHIPFNENNERSEMAGGRLAVSGGGKADPLTLWDRIDSLIASRDFQDYAAVLSDDREKLITFDLKARTWSASRDWYAIEQMKSGSYTGLPHQPRVLTKARGVTTPDVYNYLYCVGRVGMDCSGFVWYVLTSVARAGGLDLNRALYRYLGAPRAADASLYIGSWFFDPRNKNLTEVKDEVRNLKPLDVIMFRGLEGATSHTAVIQSVDLAGGEIRYMQSTDVAEQDERGVHESLITFDPGKPWTSLKDPSIVWHQKRSAPFLGETSVDFWNDGERYRAFPEYGGGTVVRLKMMQKLSDRPLKARPKQGTRAAPP